MRAEARWRTAGKTADLLLPAGLRLAEAEEILAEFGTELDRQDPALGAYVRASGQRARRRQRLTQAAAAVFALLAIAAGWFWWQADQNAQLAAARAIEANEVAAERDRQRAQAEASAMEAAENARIAQENATRAEEALAEANSAREDLAIAADNAFRMESRFLVEQARAALLDNGTEADMQALRMALDALPADPLADRPDRPIVAEAVRGIRDVVDAVETRRERRAAETGAFLEATLQQVDLGPLEEDDRVPFAFHSSRNMLAVGRGTRLEVMWVPDGDRSVATVPGTAMIEHLTFLVHDGESFNLGAELLVFLSDGTVLSYSLGHGTDLDEPRVVAPATGGVSLLRVSVSRDGTRALVDGPQSALIDPWGGTYLTELERGFRWHFTNDESDLVGFSGSVRNTQLAFRSPAETGERVDEIATVPFDLWGALPGAGVERQFFWGPSYSRETSGMLIYEIGYVPQVGVRGRRPLLTGMEGDAIGSVYLADEERLYVWSNDNMLRAWDLAGEGTEPELPATLQVEVDVRSLRGVEFFQDHQFAVLWGLGERIPVLETTNGSQIGELTAPWDARLAGSDSLRWAGARPQHDQVVLASADRVELWDLMEPTRLAQMSGFDADAVDIALSSDGTYAATLHRDGRLRVWEIPNPGQPYVETTAAERLAESRRINSDFRIAGCRIVDGVTQPCPWWQQTGIRPDELAELMERANLLIETLSAEQNR